MDFNLIAQFSFFDPSSLWAIFQMVIGLGFVIFVHELGHFLVAKACGVKCEKFYLGFDAFDIKIGDRVLIPRKLVKFTWGETEYGVGILPLGGYVKMLGQDDNPAQIAEERKRSIETGEEAEAPKLDPRSYQAKTVPQRMAIISAGVIMNLIFAVIFASIAFGTGVNYEPPQVGSTTPGSPAWQHDLDGSTIVTVGDETTKKRYYTFGHLREAIVFDGQDEPIRLSILPPPTEKELSAEPSDNSNITPINVSVIPATNLITVKGAESLPAIGIGPAMSAVLAGTPPVVEGSAASKASEPLMTGDKIVSVAGKSIVRILEDENGKTYKQHNVFLLRMLLAQHRDEPVEMIVERTDKATKEVKLVKTTLPANPMKTIGLAMELGPVYAIQFGSPAEEAGIRADDVITMIDGAPVGDPFTLQSRMERFAGKPVEFTINRPISKGNSDRTIEEFEALKVTVKPNPPRAPATVDYNRPMAIDSLGIAVYVKNKVANSNDVSAASSNLGLAGREVTKVKFIPAEDDKTKYSATALQTINLNKNPHNWPVVNSWIQQFKPGTTVELTVNDGNTNDLIELKISEYEGFHTVARGFPIQPEQMVYQAQSFSESISLGFNQTWMDATKVIRFLGKLIRGDIPITGLGGPGTIAMVATSEASQGTSRLLLFLTLLSANLAVINFLPIPILDGGHMVFLMYEGIFRRPVSERLQIILSFGGLIFIVGLMVLVISLDVWRWSGLFG